MNDLKHLEGLCINGPMHGRIVKLRADQNSFSVPVDPPLEPESWMRDGERAEPVAYEISTYRRIRVHLSDTYLINFWIPADVERTSLAEMIYVLSHLALRPTGTAAGLPSYGPGGGATDIREKG